MVAYLSGAAGCNGTCAAIHTGSLAHSATSRKRLCVPVSAWQLSLLLCVADSGVKRWSRFRLKLTCQAVASSMRRADQTCFRTQRTHFFVGLGRPLRIEHEDSYLYLLYLFAHIPFSSPLFVCPSVIHLSVPFSMSFKFKHLDKYPTNSSFKYSAHISSYKPVQLKQS